METKIKKLTINPMVIGDVEIVFVEAHSGEEKELNDLLGMTGLEDENGVRVGDSHYTATRIIDGKVHGTAKGLMANSALCSLLEQIARNYCLDLTRESSNADSWVI